MYMYAFVRVGIHDSISLFGRKSLYLRQSGCVCVCECVRARARSLMCLNFRAILLCKFCVFT